MGSVVSSGTKERVDVAVVYLSNDLAGHDARTTGSTRRLRLESCIREAAKMEG
jgi:hypothetical protein